MTFLLACITDIFIGITGFFIGVLVTKTDDTFLDSFKKWLDEEKSDKKQRIAVEYDIEKTLPDFRKWVKEKTERKRKQKRIILFCCSLLLAAGILFYTVYAGSSRGRRSLSSFQFNTTQQSDP